MSFFIYNGKFYKENAVVISADNRSLKYGDGLFETMKMVNGNLMLKEFHFERLFHGMKLLHFDIDSAFNAAFLEKKVAALAKKNGLHHTNRIRIMVFRGNGNLQHLSDHSPNYIINVSAFPTNNLLNTKGLTIDVYPQVKKSCDILANLKTNNFLTYVLASIYAEKTNVDDCVVLNTYGRICDSTIANIFIIKDQIVFTPSLSEGCIAGVMRRWIIGKLKSTEYNVIEKPITVEDLNNADEIFLTNSIHSIRWVKQFQKKKYSNRHVRAIFKALQ